MTFKQLIRATCRAALITSSAVVGSDLSAETSKEENEVHRELTILRPDISQVYARISNAGVYARHAFNSPRDYAQPLTKSEKDEIHFLIKTLSRHKGDIPSLLSKQAKLNSTKKNIIHIHPLAFLEVIFIDQELISAMKSMNGRNFVWSKFKKNLFNTLDEENGEDNVLPYIESFANKIHIDTSLLIPPAQKADWNKFLSNLMEYAPREGNPGRYNKM